ncbi:chemotaxis protein CheW [Geosporobacter ferrireducens]|uniref:Chemotaxis protein CheW n=1 Tax=Geosporobacter ferrireducens TaxID=1424294 RepID=A0A1D8GPA5_9FIRM|nr:chemotaxis protein CheW [Geosporobacter ferrireducens]AOT72697.1 chemotaxis protein CheW [Geosporobacter ferrireducens]MTI55106.1 purine-binding chemotaxis protein CheW [Geosporobacter ferrireducens]
MSEKQYVIFRLGKEEYGVEIVNVKEICEYKESVKVPNTPRFVDGIINLRGDITPIINLKKRFNLPEGDVNSDTRIIVININNRQVGFIVDEASQVLRITEEDIEPAPELVAGIEKKYIIGVGKLADRIILLLDLEYILSEDEKEKIQNM